MALRVMANCDNCDTRLGFERVGRQIPKPLLATCDHCGITWSLDKGMMDRISADLAPSAG